MVKKLEVKKVTPKSLMKVTLYMMIIPVALCFVTGIITIITGVIVGDSETLWVGAAISLGYLILLIIAYLVLSALSAYIYNIFAKRFGGIVMMAEEGNE